MVLPVKNKFNRCTHIGPQRSHGQGMTEYIVILALVVVAAIGVYSYFGKTVRHQVAGVAQEISGQSASQQLQSAGESANAAVNRANPEYNLSNYDNATNSGN
ncbi:pilus assembly protein [Aliidiomarina sanyensis]|uniref:Pilus assembly protein n=2 Tax=Aliidiomarina sanyensis TaxID=1249555 RepID=A0A432WEQ8_9GAMM|nr:pilus assembly protein [Aliidiomarina sanyensis]